MLFKIILYMLFSLAAAPIESWSYLLNGLGELDPVVSAKLVWHPFSGGLIYVLSIILLAETLFRMGSHWSSIRESFLAKFVIVSSIISFLVMFGLYTMTERQRIIVGAELYDSTGKIQLLFLVISLVVAWTSFAMTEARKDPSPK